MPKFKMPKGISGKATSGLNKLMEVAVTCGTMAGTLEPVVENMKAGVIGEKEKKELDYQLEQFQNFYHAFSRWRFLPGFAQVPKDFKNNIERLRKIIQAVNEKAFGPDELKLLESVLNDLQETNQKTMNEFTKQGWK